MNKTSDSKVEILLATYNGEKYIREQIESVINQTYKEWELLVHDDCSTDQTLKIIKDIQGYHPGKITIIEDGIRTGGAKQNFQHLLNHSHADYIMFCDQDDLWLENKIEACMKVMNQEEKEKNGKPIIIHTDIIVVDEYLNTIAPSMFKQQKLQKNLNSFEESLLINNITGCTMLINRQAAFFGMNMPKEAIMHDWWIGIKTLQNSGTVKFLDQPTIKYRQHANNTIGYKDYNLRYFTKKILNIKKTVHQASMAYKQAKTADPRINSFIWSAQKIIKSILRVIH